MSVSKYCLLGAVLQWASSSRNDEDSWHRMVHKGDVHSLLQLDGEMTRRAPAWKHPFAPFHRADDRSVLNAAEAEFVTAVRVAPSLSQTAAAVTNAATAEMALPAVAGEAQTGGSGLMQELQVSTTSTLVAYMATACIISGVIVVLFWSKGWLVICRIIFYLLALSTMKLSVKYLFVDYGFNFPKFVTATHFLSGAVVAFSILLCRRSTPDMPSKGLLATCPAVSQRLGVPTVREFWLMVVPISMGFAISVAANNVALLFSSAAFTEIVGSTSPVVSIILIILLGMPFDMRLLGPTFLVVAGCALSTSGEIHFSGLGMACCVISIIGRAFKTTLQQRVLTGESKDKFDPVTLLAWMCIPSAVLMSIWSMSVEGTAPITMLLESNRRRSLLFFLAVSCVNACILNLSNLFCTKDLGAVGVQLVAQTKAVLTVLGAVALFHEAVTPIEVLGFIGVLIGVFLFSHIEKLPKNEDTGSESSLSAQHKSGFQRRIQDLLRCGHMRPWK